MKKNYSLILIALLCSVLSSSGQIITFDFNGLAGNEVSAASNFNNPNLSNSTITRGAGLNAAINANRFNATNWADTNIATAIAGNNYMEFTITPNVSYQFNVTDIVVNFERSATGPRGILLRSSLDGYITDIDTEKVIADDTSVQSFTFTVGQTGNTSAVTYRIYGWAEATGGTGGFEGTGNDITVNGSVNLSCTDAVDFENIYLPTTSPETITQGDPFVVSTQAVEPGVTNLPGEATGIQAWIGYSTTNNDPSTSAGWTWLPATYSFDIGANDVHIADIGSGLAPGTYYYASRHGLNGCAFTYGGTLGPYWSNDSQILIVDAPPLADVVITEIMYNSIGTDDEWIEICNVSGSPQALNGCTIEVGGTTEFTFPNSGIVLADGDCITIALGEDIGNPNFNPDCPFTPDYTNGAGTGTLNNTSDTISLVASDGSTIIDNVTYDSADGGNIESLHIIDTSLDNAVTSANWQEVINGGSPGVNALISPCTPIGPEINVEGTTTNFPDISDGDTVPNIFDGTDFGDVSVGGNSTNTFRIENFGGTTNLTISSVSVISGDIGDFSISALPTSPIAALDFSLFDIGFSPTTIGPRTAVIEIRSNDSDEDPYTFTVTGNGLCVATAIIAEPSSGPAGTVVTVTGANLSTATASFNGLVATVTNISATVMEVIVPAGASTGNLEILDDLGCPGTTSFTVVESQISGCEGSSGTTPTDLFISEVTDSNTGGLTYIEIYNGTGATINLASYSIQFFNNGNVTENGGSVNLSNVNLATSNTFVFAVNTGSNCTGISGADGSLADQIGFGGINFVVNGDDHIRLYEGANHIDSWGEYLSNTWADPLNIGSEGVAFTRNNSAGSLPNTTFNIADWSYVDWTACADNDYSNIGTYDFSTGTPPIINTQPNLPAISCDTTVSISIAASEGFAGGNPLAYQWYFNAPGDSGWTPVTNGSTYSGATSTSLNLLDAVNLNGYQYYCEVRENTASCFTASNAVRLVVEFAVWDGFNWSLPPSSSRVAVIDGPYDTDQIINGEISFEACQLIVNAGAILTIHANDFVSVINNVTVNGNIVINPYGSFVQINDSGIVEGTVLTDKTRISVEKETGFLNSDKEYTYWGSPVVGEIIGDGLQDALDTRRFSFNAQNFLDATQETNNDNTAVAGQDDIDDNGDDWTPVGDATVMEAGVGYASTHDPAIFFAPARYIYIFQGPFNNGVINVPIYRNDAETNDNNWNFIGNPYPSAIDADAFLAANASIDQTVGATSGAIFFWSHNTPADGNTNGNEALNYTQSDYAIINGTGQTAGGDGVVPDRFIPSGQGFFVSMTNAVSSTVVSGTIRTTDIVFNNSMRVNGNNSQFFRTSQDSQLNNVRLNLTSDNGIFNQILIGYVDGATNDDDGMYYDAYKNLSADANALLYSLLDNSTNKKYAIQGKAPSDLSIDEIIPLGFYTAIDDPTLYTISLASVEGEFMTSNTVYLRDNILGIVHDLSSSDYSFTSDPGEVNTRFEILFQPETLSLTENEMTPNDLIILELGDGDVKFSAGQSAVIKQVEIIDVVGRTIYKLKGNNNQEIYNLSRLSQAAYIAKVTLSNGQILTKKAVKRN
ncbi:Lamin Tail Domain [Formosa sp. Hel1_31_208]|uniref:lamin tail domain-containing protein n=1 Tax=Formosa sp. Hel1_31_208 TaxID=1798225 RepID=UPI0008799A24|nr:lamin tail domain-containing protein [Formosa sp. Hel1_31_208]SDR79697.1 Lamin Tail Domain [Formosa sp. Hel1_31_208]